MDDDTPSQVAHLDLDNDDALDEESLIDDFDPDEWKQLQAFELPESIRQLFAEAGVLDAMPEGSAGPGDEVPMPWDSDSYGPLVDRRPPQTIEEVDGEPAYVEEIDETGLPWDGRQLEKQRTAEEKKRRRTWMREHIVKKK